MSHMNLKFMWENTHFSSLPHQNQAPRRGNDRLIEQEDVRDPLVQPTHFGIEENEARKWRGQGHSQW